MKYQTTKRHRECQIHIAKWKKAVWKGLFGSNYTTFGKGETIESKSSSGCQEFQVGKRDGEDK